MAADFELVSGGGRRASRAARSIALRLPGYFGTRSPGLPGFWRSTHAAPALRASDAKRERLDATAAMAAGSFAGALCLLLMLAFGAAIYGEAPIRLLRMIAATVRGPGTMALSEDFDLPLATLGLVMYFAYSAAFALAMTGVMIECPRRASRWVGLAAGAAFYGVNLYGCTLLFPWFAELRTLDTFVAHVAFGLLVSQSYASFAAPHESR